MADSSLVESIVVDLLVFEISVRLRGEHLGGSMYGDGCCFVCVGSRLFEVRAVFEIGWYV
jgi:hypothetical protein